MTVTYLNLLLDSLGLQLSKLLILSQLLLDILRCFDTRIETMIIDAE